MSARLKRPKKPLTIFVEVSEPVLARRIVLRRLTLSPSLANVHVQDLADLATDLGFHIGFGIAPLDERAIPRNGTCLQ